MKIPARTNGWLMNALEDGLDCVVEFQTPEPVSTQCFFSIDAGGDLTVVYEDLVAGETAYQIDFDDVVRDLLDAFSQAPPANRAEEARLLRRLAGRFEGVAGRLAREAAARDVGGDANSASAF